MSFDRISHLEEGAPAITWAAAKGYLKIVKYLVKKGGCLSYRAIACSIEKEGIL